MLPNERMDGVKTGSGLGHALFLVKRKTRTWRRMPAAEKLLFFPAFLLLALARAALLGVPFRVFSRWLGDAGPAAALVPLATEEEVRRALLIGRAVRTAARYTPWESKCLAQALAARVLLGAAGLPYALHLGVSTRTPTGLEAHAWVCTGRAAVTGGRGFVTHTVVATFLSPRLAATHGTHGRKARFHGK